MNYKKLVSVIVPAYNAEQYLTTCIESVLCQSYKNIELIIVDDGSKDSTLKISEQYSQAHSFVRVFSKENGGLSSARLFGFKQSAGEYIIFLDSDDYIESEFITNLFEQLSNRKDEIVMCDFLLEGKKESENCQYLEMNNKKEIFDQFLDGGIYNRTVNKIYPRELISESDFPVGRDMLEDAFFTSHILEKCNHAIRISYAGYNYIRHSGSISKSRLSPIKRTGMHSDILEKDIFLSRNISTCNHQKLVKKVIKHIKECLFSVDDLDLYSIKEKIVYLIGYIASTNPEEKATKRFVEYMIKAKSKKEIKKQFKKYVFLNESFSNKVLFLKSIVRLKILHR